MVKGSNKINSLNTTHSIILELIQYWKLFLGINEWEILCESISEMQVVDALDNNTFGHEFVGISINFKLKQGIIHHTRKLEEDDIIHELLHVRYPKWSEQKVNLITNLLRQRSIFDIGPRPNMLLANG